MLRYILLSDEQRKRIIEYVKPVYRDVMTYDNLNLAYGVEDTDKKFVLTMVYYLSDFVMRCGAPDQNSYIILAQGRVLTATTYGYSGDKQYSISFSGDLMIRKSNVEEAIAYYNDRSERAKFEESNAEELNGRKLYDLVFDEREKLFPKKNEKVSEQSEQKYSNKEKKISDEDKSRTKKTRAEKSRLVTYVYGALAIVMLFIIVASIIALCSGMPCTKKNVMGIVTCVIFGAVCVLNAKR